MSPANLCMDAFELGLIDLGALRNSKNCPLQRGNVPCVSAIFVIQTIMHTILPEHFEYYQWLKLVID